MDYALKDFEKDVLEASKDKPVLVDFWAEWCGPCRILGPVLEKLAAEHSNEWKLVKVDTEKFPELSQQYGIYGIPNVKLFIDGEVKNEFTGALPEHAIRTWLKDAIPGQFDNDINKARELLHSGNEKEADTILERVLESESNNQEARALLATSVVFTDPDKALGLVEGILADAKVFDIAEGVRTVARLSQLRQQPDQLAEADVKALYLAAIEAAAVRDFDKALQQFIQVIRQDRYYDDDGARKACIAIFKVLGEENEISIKHRREFGSALYV